jgi:gamma-glutamylcyclotransferase (GGCT)/AIG2-like uncharacterized protein YtfP
MSDIFVYGTLLEGESNHGLLADAEFLGIDRLTNAQLFNLGDYPMIVPGEGLVLGEAYRISPAILQKLDILEEHPDYYQRGLVTLQSSRIAFAYWGQTDLVIGYSIIASGSWRDRFNFHQDFMKNS